MPVQRNTPRAIASGAGAHHHAGMSRRFHVVCLLLASACGPGSGGSSDDSSGGATSAGTSAGDTTATPTTGSSTSAPGTTTDPDTGGTTVVTGDGTTTDPSATTGPQACEAIVGSTECAALAEVSGDLSFEECTACQAAPCGTDPICDGQYPCIDGAIVVKGCCSDAQCAGLTPFCGMFIGTNNVCVLQDDR